MELASSAIEFKVEIGKRLIKAKELLPHGKFTSWATGEFCWSRRHVQRHMLLARKARRVFHLGPEASLRAALAALHEPVQLGEAPAQEAAESYLLRLTWPSGEDLAIPPRPPQERYLRERGLATAEITLERRAA